MNRCIELHDSTLESISLVERDAVVLLAPAYVHSSEGQPGVDPGSGWLQDFELHIREAVIDEAPTQLSCWIIDGSLSVADTLWDNVIPLPCAKVGHVTLSAVTEHGENLLIRGAAIEARLRGEARYLEECP